MAGNPFLELLVKRLIKVAIYDSYKNHMHLYDSWQVLLSRGFHTLHN